MTFIDTTAPADAQGDVLQMYERQQQFWGYVPNYAKVFSGRPEVLARWGRLLAEIKRPMPGQRFELVTFAAALQLRNTGCSLQHGKLLADHIGEEAVCALGRGESVEQLSEEEVAIFQFAQKVAGHAHRVSAGEVARLKGFGLGDEEIFDIAAAAAGRAFFAKLLDGLGVEADSAFLQLDEKMRKALRVGRPIGFREPERVPEHRASADEGGQVRIVSRQLV